MIAMSQALPKIMLEKLSRQIACHMGLNFPRSKWRDLENAFTAIARELGFPGTEECITWFLSTAPTRELIGTVADFLTVGETYFLREPGGLEIVMRKMIPEIIRARQVGEKRLRIWSAGCSTGEEPYSLAVMLRQMKAELRDFDVSILATDINPKSLRKAVKGVYTEWSFRKPPQWLKGNYFIKNGAGCYEILPEIRNMVNFTYFNLAEDIYPSLLNNTNAMDIIFCRNVLMYFTPELAEKVTERLHHCLVEGGWLVVSPCETSQFISSRFTAVHFPDAILYRKQEPKVEVQTFRVEAQVRSVPDVMVPGLLPAAEMIQPNKNRRSTVISPPTPLSQCTITDSPPDPHECALRLYALGEYAEAAKSLEEHLLLACSDSRALALLCRIRANEGKLAEALLLSERAIAADKLNAGLHYLRAVILQEQDAVEEAAASLKRALYLDQELVLAHFSLGNLALRQGKVKESRKYFDNAMSLLKRYAPDETVPEADGMLADRLQEIILATAGREFPDMGSRQGETVCN